ncbi:hypothetical protein, partial [Vibrio hepatarius]|uniref:hypothetical protein n=1 Tax=Vibrio hepatarius TaxID=171383 RepID=UPI00142E2CFA
MKNVGDSSASPSDEDKQINGSVIPGSSTTNLEDTDPISDTFSFDGPTATETNVADDSDTTDTSDVAETSNTNETSATETNVT